MTKQNHISEQRRFLWGARGIGAESNVKMVPLHVMVATGAEEGGRWLQRGVPICRNNKLTFKLFYMSDLKTNKIMQISDFSYHIHVIMSHKTSKWCTHASTILKKQRYILIYIQLFYKKRLYEPSSTTLCQRTNCQIKTIKDFILYFICQS